MQPILKSVKSADEWTEYNYIRRTVLFENRGQIGVYDPNHPDEHIPANHPMLLFLGNTALGTIRIDLVATESMAIFRRIAIRGTRQGRGFGRILMKQAEDFAIAHGCTNFVTHAALDAIGFYEKTGYKRDESNANVDGKNLKMVKIAQGG